VEDFSSTLDFRDGDDLVQLGNDCGTLIFKQDARLDSSASAVSYVHRHRRFDF
jgi:hypothetical protein